MRKIFFLITFLSISSLSFTQSLKFVETTHEFYHVHEVNGTVEHQFIFTNISSNDVKIKTIVSNACPCLSFTWKQGDIASKAKGNVTVTLEPSNRRGMFSFPFTVVVEENKKEVNYDLVVKGYIVPKPQTKEEEYSMKEGNLRYKTNQKKYIMHREEVLTDTFHFYNDWGTTMTFKAVDLSPSIKVSYITPSLEPKGEGVVVFTYDANVKNDWGNVFDRLFVETNDTIRGRKTFYIIAEIYDNFGAWTEEEMKNAPHIYSEQTEYDFGVDTVGKTITHVFTIKNIGKSNLLIRKVKTSCGCTTLQQIKTELEPGETAPVEVVFRTHGKRGRQLRNIDLITNDPDQPKISLFIKGDLIEVPANR